METFFLNESDLKEYINNDEALEKLEEIITLARLMNYEITITNILSYIHIYDREINLEIARKDNKKIININIELINKKMTIIFVENKFYINNKWIKERGVYTLSSFQSFFSKVINSL